MPDRDGRRVHLEGDYTGDKRLCGCGHHQLRLNSTPSTRHKKRTFIIQFFRSDSEDPYHFGEGQTFLGQTEKKTDRQRNIGPFTFVANGDLSNKCVTATATNKKTGDTSEFSNAEAVQGIGAG